MANKKRESSVTPAQIIAARGALSQTAAAALLGLSLRHWRNYETGSHAMKERDFEFFANAVKPKS